MLMLGLVLKLTFVSFTHTIVIMKFALPTTSTLRRADLRRVRMGPGGMSCVEG